MKRSTSIVLSAVLLLSTVAATCSKQSLVSNANDVLTALTAARPLINQLLPRSGVKFDQAITIATKLKDAVAASQTTEAVALLSQLIPTFSSIVNEDINQLTASQKTTILASLAIADIGLHYLASHIRDNAPQVPTAGPQIVVIVNFSNEPVWGTKYKTSK